MGKCIVEFFKPLDMSKEVQATIIATGEKVLVYKSSLRNTWINSSDLRTEYKPNELKF